MEVLIAGNPGDDAQQLQLLNALVALSLCAQIGQALWAPPGAVA